MGDRTQAIYEIDNVNIAKSVECDWNDLAKQRNIHKTDLNIISQNIRSIYCNFDDLLINLSSLPFEVDIIILTECRIHPDKPIPILNNYHSYSTIRQLNQNDGVVVYVKNTLTPNVVELNLTHASGLQIDIFNKSILGIYRSPSNPSAELFIDSLSRHLSTLTSQKNIIVAGDININIKPIENELPNEFKNRISYLDMLSAHGILPGHILITRDRRCLDHFMLRIDKKTHSAFIAILRTSITDHLTTFLSITKTKINQTSPKTTTRTDFESALKWLQEKDLSPLLRCDNPNLITDNLIQGLTDKRIIKPWITNGILKCIRNRNRLQKESKNDPLNEIKRLTFTRYRNFCNNLIKKLKRKYERRLIENSINDNKILWKNIKTLTYTNKSKKKPLSECKPKIINWLQELDYAETEALVN
ncbi:hypothetical protein ABMA28_009516 [Loxostege sticticalis]|uniref:Endonuclease/exonuclease/phosphatase domain-containing protein n=1 Tax=Loxostege sticticalis TaxID=481309 RepID=A0ABD0SFM5_LOXSC